MTEQELYARGFAGGDSELAARYQDLIGTAPAFAPDLDPEWRRAMMYELVTAAACGPPPRRRRRVAAAGGKPHRAARLRA